VHKPRYPKHLFLVTPKDNISDMTSNGKQAKGCQLPQIKFTDYQVREIKVLLGEKKSISRVVKLFDIEPPSILSEDCVNAPLSILSEDCVNAPSLIEPSLIEPSTIVPLSILSEDCVNAPSLIEASLIEPSTRVKICATGKQLELFDLDSFTKPKKTRRKK